MRGHRAGRRPLLLLLPFAALLSIATFSLHSPRDLTTTTTTHSPSHPPTISALDFRALFSYAASPLHAASLRAFQDGVRLLHGLEGGAAPPRESNSSCPPSVALSCKGSGVVVRLPCGLALGSHVTLVGAPRRGDAKAVAQFAVELRGGEEEGEEAAARILHFNPRLRGDWSGRPVIEQNTRFRGQWGVALRCDGRRSRPDEETVDGLVKCEQWIGNEEGTPEELKRMSLLSRTAGRKKKDPIDWPFPFVEGELFVLTLSAGLDGYHVQVDGRHVTSFPYRIGFVLEDATLFSVNGDIDVESIVAGSLPTSHPSIEQKNLELLTELKAPVSEEPVELFIGILSAGNHFAERMAVRRSWMSSVRNSSSAVARFFVALNGRKEANEELKKEADFFGDTVIVPFVDSYDLVVLKTVAICEYATRVVSAKYVMKCDDDTFVRLDSVMSEVKKIPDGKSLYLGNINYYHKPLREGKWAVTYEEWPQEAYPPYANGPGYVVSSDIANFVVSEMEKTRLNLFKMEDVSMGVWVGQFNSSEKAVEYIHSFRFCQFGCVDDYFTAHYQSPGQMICLWEKLEEGKYQCCNDR